MNGDKIVIFKNSLHQRVIFNQKYLFCESIDMTGLSGIHSVQNLAFSDGQVTVSHQLGAKTIPCSFAFKNTKNDGYTKNLLENIFIPKDNGTLTVITKDNTYSIDCSPQNVPVFKRDEVKFVYRFDIDFVSDSSLWRKGNEISVTLNSAETVILSDNPHELPMKIIFPASNSATLFNVNGKGFTLKKHTMSLTVDTQTFTVKDGQGKNQNQYIDATAELDEIFFHFGENKIICSPFTDVKILYYQLSCGEM